VLEDRRAAFCARLKASRERKGVSLEEIAASTKVGRSLLKGLEDNDLSRWPQGLYRRSYLRDYLRAIDLPAEPTVAEFVRLFPNEDTSILDAAPPPDVEEPGALSMTLGEAPAERFAKARKRLAAAAIDLVAVLIVSAVVWRVIQSDFWAGGTIVALAYYSASTAALGCSFGTRWLEDTSWRRPKASPSPSPSGDSLFMQLRGMKGLPEQPNRSMLRRLASVACNAALFRILFLR
jgi:transcriptional regulator with XRE-family HTH domain